MSHTPSCPPKPPSAVARLSDLMREAAASGGGVTADELAALGVSSDDLARHGAAAAQRAGRMSLRRLEREAA